LIGHTRRTVVAVDLPGHGRSTLHSRFTFELASEAIQRAIEHAGLVRPTLVGHSMGGPIALTTLRASTPHAFTGFVAVASSAYWVRPRHQLKVAAAPYLLGPDSPVTLRRQRAEERRDPEQARMIAWEYAVRPGRPIMEESAAELRRFDARPWTNLNLPPALWIVTAEDGVISPEDQRASAARFKIPAVDVPFDHRLTTQAATRVAEIIESSVREWGRQLPIGIRPRANRPYPSV
jgi:pimeloyl-ACP methyl ester carboxylesterase